VIKKLMPIKILENWLNKLFCSSFLSHFTAISVCFNNQHCNQQRRLETRSAACQYRTPKIELAVASPM